MVIPLWAGANSWPPPGNSLLSAGSRIFYYWAQTIAYLIIHLTNVCGQTWVGATPKELDSSLEEESVSGTKTALV